MISFNKKFLWSKIIGLTILCHGNLLNAEKVGRTNWEEAKRALQTVHYAYSYAIHDEIVKEVQSKYSYVQPIMHEKDDEWLAGLVLGNGRKMTLVFGGADNQDVEDFCNHFAGRYPSWGKGSITGKVHGGFLKHFHGLWPQIYAAILKYSEITQRDPAKIDFEIVGHSMGAGLAHIAAMRLKTGLLYRTILPQVSILDLPQYSEEDRPSEIKVITFGGMRVLDDIAALEYKKRLNLERSTLRVSHENDWVVNKIPRICGVLHVGSSVELPDPDGILDFITGQVAESHRLASYHVALNQLIQSEEEFVKGPKKNDDSFFGGMIGVLGFAVTGPAEILINSLTPEQKEEAKQVDREREKALELAILY